MPPFKQYKQWMIERYGDALFRVPVQLASSCPHGRCAFCSEAGARAQQTQRQESPIDQIEAAIKFSKRRYKAQKLMLYIQAFTADLTDPAQQKKIIECLTNYPFEAISIGTRPDCLPSKALDFLQSLPSLISTPLEVWVELGVQTANDDTLKRINRGHDWACSKQAIRALANRGVHVAPHVIIGLPNETSTDWNHTAAEIAALPISGIKIHNLHIMQGTELAAQFSAAPFPVLNHWEYAEALFDFLRRIPADIPVMRISTDTPDDQLIAPHWHLEKGQFLDYVVQQMPCRQIRQGDLTNEIPACGRTGKPQVPPRQEPITPVITADGSVTFFSSDWKEHYHTKSGARLEALKKFVEPAGLSHKLQAAPIKLLDVCFGLGNNSLAALCAANHARHPVDITALEIDKRVVRAAAEAFQPVATDPVNWNETLQKLLSGPISLPRIGTIDLRFGDARYLVQLLKSGSFDIIFHDPFSSQHCPELWTVEFFQQLYRILKPDGILLTYASALPVRSALHEADFLIGETHPGHSMGNGTLAVKQLKDLTGPSLEIPAVRRSIPYRDPYLCATSKTILRNRQEALEKQPAADLNGAVQLPPDNR